jgi:hypothetical protein
VYLERVRRRETFHVRGLGSSMADWMSLAIDWALAQGLSVKPSYALGP